MFNRQKSELIIIVKLENLIIKDYYICPKAILFEKNIPIKNIP